MLPSGRPWLSAVCAHPNGALKPVNGLDIKSTELDQHCLKCSAACGPLKPKLRAPAKIEIEHDPITRLRPEAAGREVSVHRLIRDLLDIIVDDKLTTAILDD